MGLSLLPPSDESIIREALARSKIALTARVQCPLSGEMCSETLRFTAASKNRIEATGPLNQYCALAVDIESMLRGLSTKIVVQHIRGKTGHCHTVSVQTRLTRRRLWP